MKLYEEIFIILFFLFLYFPLIKGTDDECVGCNAITRISCSGSSGSSCNVNCRPKFTTSICYFCDFSGQNYYKINDVGTCSPKSACDDGEKIVYQSNECVSSCDTNSYKMGDYCYLNIPLNSECDTTSKVCTCKYKYFITYTNKQEYHCLGENEDCPLDYNYYDADTKECGSTGCSSSKKKKIEYRSNGSLINRCSTACFDNELLISDDYCIKNCPETSNQLFYYPNENDEKIVKCVSDCSIYSLKKLNNKCVSSCANNNHYLVGNICFSTCSSGFYKLVGTEKVCVDEADRDNCLYSKSESESSIKRCYGSCLEIGANYIYQKGSMCSNEECTYYSNENDIKICYDTKQDCNDKDYLYLQGKKCLKECNGFIYEDDILNVCYATLDDCIGDNHNYYTLSPKKCYSSSCPEGFHLKYPVESDGYLCIDCTNLKISNIYCKESCDDNECYFEDTNSNQCNPISDNFYYINEISGKKICVNDCKSKGKFFFPGTKECLQECKKTISGVGKKFYYDPTDNSCLEQCPILFKFLVENTYKCLSECPENYPYYLKDANYATNNHLICKRFHPCSGDNYLILDGQCASPQNCETAGKNKINSKNICESSCEGSYSYIEKVTNGVYKCRQNCNNKYIINTNECVDKCPFGNHYISSNNVCEPNCDVNENKFYLFSEEDGYKIYKCKSSCPAGYLLTKYDNSDNQCYSKCPDSHKYLLSSENKCYDSCKNVASYPFSLTYIENNIEKYICASSCNSANPNYEDIDKECKSGCNIGNKRVIDYDGKCIDKCVQTSNYKFNLDGKCVNKCTGNKNRYYDENSEYICVENCLAHDNYILNDKCVSQTSCSNSEYYYNPVKKNGIATGEYECVLNCPNGFFKTENSDKICVEQCLTTDFALIDTKECVSDCNIQIPGDSTKTYHTYKPGTTYTINTCVKDCPEDKPYLNGNECTNSCPNYIEDNKCVTSCTTHNYYIGQILPNDEETLNICRDDCPQKYPYYIENPQDNNKFICSHECTSGLRFHKNDDPSKIGMKCINSCPDNTYKFLSDDEKECLKQCPSGKYYINDVDQKCYANACPEAKPYHSRNNYECKSMEDCPKKFIDYSNKLCIDSCSGFKYKYEKKNDIDNTQISYTVCLNDCSLFNKYLTPGNICVDSCDENANLELDTSVPYKCKCKYLYYKDLSNSITYCLNQNDNCATTTSYKIQKINTNECLNKCPNILSLNGDLCYNSENECGFNEKLITLSNGQKQCDCIYKFYLTDNNLKTCLASSEKCPSGRNYYIPTLKQCIGSCPANLNYIFQNYCLDQCPKGATLVSGECKCENDKNWYSISDTNYECLPGKCLESHPFLVSETKQCLEKCKNTEYPHLINNECHANCDSFANTESTPIDYYASNYEFASYTCRCKNLWYFDETQQKNICPSGSDIKNTCKEFTGYNFNYLVKSTNQCVVSCPSDYSYSFNDECFFSCANAKEQFDLDVKINPSDTNSKVCICNNLWKYETVNSIKKISCLQLSECPEDNFLEIFDTRQCLEFGENEPLICPRESPLELNKICYKEDNCPINSHYDPNIAGKCVCDNLWYLIPNNKIHCMSNDTSICPDDYPYQIFKTKECIKAVETTETKCPTEHPYFFNYICYENKCPELTKLKGETKFCICDETKGKWYKYNKINPNSEKIYYYCGLDKCPNENPNKPNLLEAKKQCTYNCDEDGETEFIWAFRNLCYKECPEFTKEDPIQKKCIFYLLDEAKDLEELKNYVSVQVKELYESGPRGGNIYNNFDASLQIYPFNKGGNLLDKNIIMKSNLTYIDLGTCLNKIFEDQNLDENDQIFIVKYDLLNHPKEEEEPQEEGATDITEKKDIKNYDSHLINEVEYEFYSSKTLERIEASVCEPKEIIVSYPISYTLSKFDDANEGYNLNEYRNKFVIGKELFHQNNKVDTFNSNNSVYKDLCTPIVINGKDLVIEARYDFLYPNNITLCEKNCTLYYTDYELGRINCKCDYKEILDFNREMPAESDLLNDPNFVYPSQSGANAEIIKCLSKLPDKDSIIKNEAFYYCLVITAGEIAMVFVAGFYGIKLVKSSIYNLGRKNNLNNNNKVNKYQNDNNNILTSTNRLLNNSNPPKKNNMIVNDDKDSNDEEERPKNVINKKSLFNPRNIRNNNSIEEKYETKESNDDDNKINYGIEIKNIETIPKNNIANEDLKEIKYKHLKDIKGKSEFIPVDYNFKFFKASDKGVIKKIKRTEIPFKIKSGTKYLLEHKENINYDKNYLNGPIYSNQNLIEIIDEEKEKGQEENGGNKPIIINKSINNIENNYNVEVKKEKHKIRNITSEKSFINIKTISPANKRNETDDYFVEEENKEKQKINESVSLYSLIKREQMLLRTPYQIYLEKDHSNLLAIILAEIMDKIYLIKICCFLKPYEMFSVHLFNYLLYHIMLLTLLCAFFTIKTIKKIFNESDFPNMNFYLLYGLFASIIIWVFYKAFLILIDHRDKVNDLIKIRQELNKEITNEDNKTEKEEINEELYGKKYDELIRRIKIHMSIFFVIGFLITAFCFIYLISFFAIYTGTKSKVFQAYYITLIEVALIKFVYGLCLASLRKAGESNEVKNVYNVSYICNKYIS